VLLEDKNPVPLRVSTPSLGDNQRKVNQSSLRRFDSRIPQLCSSLSIPVAFCAICTPFLRPVRVAAKANRSELETFSKESYLFDEARSGVFCRYRIGWLLAHGALRKVDRNDDPLVSQLAWKSATGWRARMPSTLDRPSNRVVLLTLSQHYLSVNIHFSRQPLMRIWASIKLLCSVVRNHADYECGKV